MAAILVQLPPDIGLGGEVNFKYTEISEFFFTKIKL